MIRRPSRRGTLEMLGLIDQDFNEGACFLFQDEHVSIPAEYQLGGTLSSLINCTCHFIHLHFNKLVNVEEKSRSSHEDATSSPATYVIASEICQTAIDSGKPSLALLRSLALQKSSSIVTWLTVLKILLNKQATVDSDILSQLGTALETLGNRPLSAERKKQDGAIIHFQVLLEQLEFAKWSTLKAVVELMSQSNPILVRLLSVWLFASSTMSEVALDCSMQSHQYSMRYQAANLGAFLVKHSQSVFNSTTDLTVNTNIQQHQEDTCNDNNNLGPEKQTCRNRRGSSLNSSTEQHGGAVAAGHRRTSSQTSQNSTGHGEGNPERTRKFSIKSTLAGLVKRTTGSSASSTTSSSNAVVSRKKRNNSKTKLDTKHEATIVNSSTSPVSSTNSSPNTSPIHRHRTEHIDPCDRRARSVSSLTREFGRPPPPPPELSPSAASAYSEASTTIDSCFESSMQSTTNTSSIETHQRTTKTKPEIIKDVSAKNSNQEDGNVAMRVSHDSENTVHGIQRLTPPMLRRQANKLEDHISATTDSPDSKTPPPVPARSREIESNTQQHIDHTTVDTFDSVLGRKQSQQEGNESTSESVPQHVPKELSFHPNDTHGERMVGDTSGKNLEATKTTLNNSTEIHQNEEGVVRSHNVGQEMVREEGLLNIPPPVQPRHNPHHMVEEQSDEAKNIPPPVQPRHNPHNIVEEQSVEAKNIPPPVQPRHYPHNIVEERSDVGKNIPPPVRPRRTQYPTPAENQPLPPVVVPSGHMAKGFGSIHQSSSQTISKPKQPPVPPPRPSTHKRVNVTGTNKDQKTLSTKEGSKQLSDNDSNGEQILPEVAPPTTLRHVPYSMPDLKPRHNVGPVATWQLPNDTEPNDDLPQPPPLRSTGQADSMHKGKQDMSNARFPRDSDAIKEGTTARKPPLIPRQQNQQEFRTSALKREMNLVSIAAQCSSDQQNSENTLNQAGAARPVSEMPDAAALARARKSSGLFSE